MDSLRAFLAGVAMLFFGAVVFVGWGIMTILPILSGQRPYGDIGLLLFWTALSLGVWRLAGGPGWGLEPDADDESSAVKRSRSGLASNEPPQERIIPTNWARVLNHHGVTSESLEAMLDELYEQEDTLPNHVDVFRAFRLTKVKDVRVVIVGQDPYYTPGLADGLAFSVRKGTPPPPSLASMLRALESDPAVVSARPSSGNLSRWAKQGVLLLNAALTVKKGNPGSHLKIWHRFTLAVLRVLAKGREPIAFLAFGNDAVNLVAEAGVSSPHVVIAMAHPVAWANTNLPKVADARPFSAANSFLTRHGRGQVDW